MYTNLHNVKDECLKCVKCSLAKTRNCVVFSDGNPKAQIMLIGEAPGAEEDKSGKPFAGRAGKLLNEFLQQAGINREKDLYITNTVKCRPPENRVPAKKEKESCERFLNAQIDLIRPKIIILCGATAAASFINTKEKISQIRGKFFDGPHKSLMIPVFHPSYLLRNHSTQENSPRDLMLRDLKSVKEKIARTNYL